LRQIGLSRPTCLSISALSPPSQGGYHRDTACSGKCPACNTGVTFLNWIAKLVLAIDLSHFVRSVTICVILGLQMRSISPRQAARAHYFQVDIAEEMSPKITAEPARQHHCNPLQSARCLTHQHSCEALRLRSSRSSGRQLR
jgi:hypothetical protein